MEMEYIYGKMGVNIQVAGKIIKCMVKAYTNGPMGEYMKETLSIITDMEKENMFNQMEKSFSDHGKIIIKMEQER